MERLVIAPVHFGSERCLHAIILAYLTLLANVREDSLSTAAAQLPNRCMSNGGGPQLCYPQKENIALLPIVAIKKTCRAGGDSTQNTTFYANTTTQEIEQHSAIDSIVDGNLSTAWQCSSADGTTQAIELTLSFGRAFQVFSVAIYTIGITPKNVTVFLSEDSGTSWKPSARLSEHCTAEDNSCRSLNGSEPPLFLVIGERRNINEATQLANFYSEHNATDVRVVVQHDVATGALERNRTSAGLSVREVQVNGFCQCYGHASRCSANGTCSCEHSTTGEDCSLCEGSDETFISDTEKLTRPSPCEEVTAKPVLTSDILLPEHTGAFSTSTLRSSSALGRTRLAQIATNNTDFLLYGGVALGALFCIIAIAMLLLCYVKRKRNRYRAYPKHEVWSRQRASYASHGPTSTSEDQRSLSMSSSTANPSPTVTANPAWMNPSVTLISNTTEIERDIADDAELENMKRSSTFSSTSAAVRIRPRLERRSTSEAYQLSRSAEPNNTIEEETGAAGQEDAEVGAAHTKVEQQPVARPVPKARTSLRVSRSDDVEVDSNGVMPSRPQPRPRSQRASSVPVMRRQAKEKSKDDSMSKPLYFDLTLEVSDDSTVMANKRPRSYIIDL